MIEVETEADFNKQLKANSHVLALFYASWCPFCRNFMSVFNKHIQTPGGNTCIKVRIDEDENSLWDTYELEAVPSLIFFENGKVKRRLDCALGVGLSENQFKKWLGTP